jgi:hypothetical protein
VFASTYHCTWFFWMKPNISTPPNSELVSEEEWLYRRPKSIYREYSVTGLTREDIAEFFQRTHSSNCWISSIGEPDMLCSGSLTPFGGYDIRIRDTDEQQTTEYSVEIRWNVCSIR